MQCAQCATPVPEDARFCHSCGSLVSDAEGQAAATGAMDASAFQHMEQLVRDDTTGEFEILRMLGRGGMAMVYLANEVHLARKVAIKVLPPELTFGHGVERFKREAKTAAALDHPNIVPIYRVASGGEIFWYAMKYLEGQSLDDLLKERGRFSLGETIGILGQVADALDYAHEHRVIHRDIKPANVMLDSRNRVVVTDFGIAKALTEGTLTASGSVIGTPYFMSPEQGMGKPVTGASDLYSVGVMAYRMLAGQVPFEGDSAIDILHKHCMIPAPPLDSAWPEAPAHVVRALQRTLEKAPERRFPTVNAFVEGLKAPGAQDAEREAATVMVPKEAASGVASRSLDAASQRTEIMESSGDPTGRTRPPMQTRPPAPKPKSRWPVRVAAGVTLLAAGAGAAWWFSNQPASTTAAGATDAAVLASAVNRSDRARRNRVGAAGRFDADGCRTSTTSRAHHRARDSYRFAIGRNGEREWPPADGDDVRTFRGPAHHPHGRRRLRAGHGQHQHRGRRGAADPIRGSASGPGAASGDADTSGPATAGSTPGTRGAYQGGLAHAHQPVGQRVHRRRGAGGEDHRPRHVDRRRSRASPRARGIRNGGHHDRHYRGCGHPDERTPEESAIMPRTIVARAVWVGIAIAILLAPRLAWAQDDRDQMIANAQSAYDNFESARAAQLLRTALNPTLGPQTGAWASGGQLLLQILIEEGQTTTARVWAPWAVRLDPTMPIDSVTFLPAVVQAVVDARVFVGPRTAADVATTTTWDWSDVNSGSATGRVSVAPSAQQARVLLIGVGLLPPGGVRDLAAGSYQIEAAADGFVTARVTREVLPGVATTLAFDLVSDAPVAQAPPPDAAPPPVADTAEAALPQAPPPPGPAQPEPEVEQGGGFPVAVFAVLGIAGAGAAVAVLAGGKKPGPVTNGNGPNGPTTGGITISVPVDP